MPVQTLPRSAERYSREQRAEIRAAALSAKRQWRRMGPEFDASFLAIRSGLLATVLTAQQRVAEGAVAYIPAVLAETGQERAVDAAAEVVPSSLVGVAGDGRPVEGLLEGAKVHAKQSVAAGRTPAQALAGAGQWLTLAVGTVLSDTGRAAESVAMAVRPVGGYVRMLNPPSCSRCAVLAGKWYRSNTGFQRHPGCDCRHIPASESVAGDLTVDPAAYFRSLDPAEQDRIFTKAGAEAIREGADVFQVVNARRGMQRAQIGGRDVLLTSEGTTRRGLAYRDLTRGADTDVRLPGARYSSARRPRLMPETIQQVATDKDDYLRLLRANGYIR